MGGIRRKMSLCFVSRMETSESLVERRNKRHDLAWKSASRKASRRAARRYARDLRRKGTQRRKAGPDRPDPHRHGRNRDDWKGPHDIGEEIEQNRVDEIAFISSRYLADIPPQPGHHCDRDDQKQQR